MITVKEEFLSDPKTVLAVKAVGSESIHMWLAMKAYAAAKLTNGFVPDVLIDDLPGAPKSPRRALRALVDCGLPQTDGSKGSGLVDQVDHGWQLHDYLDHASSASDEQRRRQKERDRKSAYRAGQTRDNGRDIARDKHGTTDGTPRGTNTGQRTGHRAGQPAPVPRDLARAPDVGARTGASPAQPSHVNPTGEPVAEEPVRSSHARTTAGHHGRVDRFVERATEPGAAPQARHDPLGERFGWSEWFPSKALLEWARTILRLTDRDVDDTLVECRDKLLGIHDVGWFDVKVVRFFEVAAQRKRDRGKPRDGGTFVVHSDPATAAAQAAADELFAEAEREAAG